MAFHIVAESCDNGPCPQIAVDPVRAVGRVRGYRAQPAPELSPPPEGEIDVEIPLDVLDSLMRQYQAR